MLFRCYSFAYVIASELCSCLYTHTHTHTHTFQQSLLECVMCSDISTVHDEWWSKDVQE